MLLEEEQNNNNTYRNRQLFVTPQGASIDIAALFNRINHTLDDMIVDATMEDMSYAYYGGNLCPFKRKISNKLINNEEIKILIVGGSVTYGADLRNRMKQRWSYSFTEMMNSGWYGGKIEVSNIGVGACNIDVWINRVREFVKADLIIVDLSVNDQGFDLQALPLLYETFIQLIDNLPNKPAIYFHYAFRGAKMDTVDIQDHCPNEYIKCCHGEMFCKRWWEMQDFVGQTLRKYGIPFVSYRDLVWPVYEHPSHQLIHFWNGLSHPDHKAHSLIAKLIAFGFMSQLQDSNRVLHCTEETNQYTKAIANDNTVKPLCLQPLVKMAANDEKTSRSTFLLHPKDASKSDLETTEFHHWTYQADSRNKFGWIVKTTADDVRKICQGKTSCAEMIEQFDLPLAVTVSADEPIIQVSYLKSYHENMGTVKIWLDNDYEHAILLNGKWDLSYSVTRLITISKEELTGVSMYIKGDAFILPGLTKGDHILHISVPACEQDNFKWKLLSVVAC